jgi:6-phospho-3-hexuloisomerase
MNDFREKYGLILQELKTALDAVDPGQVDRFVDVLLESKQVFVTGVGRVMLSMQAMSKRLNHLGIKCYHVGAINEPAITRDDLLVVASGSGESVVPLAIAKVAKKHEARVVHIGSNPKSFMAPLTDIFVRIPVRTKLALPDELQSRQVMSSLFEQSVLLLGDAVALMIVERRNLVIKDLWQYHANLE